MLDFTLSKEQQEWQKLIRDFVRVHVLSRNDLDRHGHFPRDLYQKAFEIGLITCMIPQEYGGSGKSLFETVLAAEECAYGDLGFTSSALLMRLSLAPLLLFGSEQQKEKWVRPLTQKLGFASFCFTEPEGSSNLGSRPATTIATKVNGGYLIEGSKWTITNASVASIYTVFARLSTEENSLSAFIVPRELPGIKVSAPYEKMGQRASDTAEVKFHKVFIPEENLIGQHGQGAQIAIKSLRMSRLGVGAMAVGVCTRAKELALTHCHSRFAGEGRPLIYEQEIKFRFAEIEAQIEMLKSFVWRGAWELENGQQGTLFSSSVKLLGARIAHEITNECLDLHGGKGYLLEGQIEKLVRDARLLQIYEGTEAVQKLLIADSAIRLKKKAA